MFLFLTVFCTCLSDAFLRPNFTSAYALNQLIPLLTCIGILARCGLRLSSTTTSPGRNVGTNPSVTNVSKASRSSAPSSCSPGPKPVGVRLATSVTASQRPRGTRPTTRSQRAPSALRQIEDQPWPEEDLWICAVRRRDGRRRTGVEDDVDDAEALLKKAKNSLSDAEDEYDDKNYDDAKSLARKAEGYAEDAEDEL